MVHRRCLLSIYCIFGALLSDDLRKRGKRGRNRYLGPGAGLDTLSVTEASQHYAHWGPQGQVIIYIMIISYRTRLKILGVGVPAVAQQVEDPASSLRWLGFHPQPGAIG